MLAAFGVLLLVDFVLPCLLSESQSLGTHWLARLSHFFEVMGITTKVLDFTVGESALGSLEVEDELFSCSLLWILDFFCRFLSFFLLDELPLELSQFQGLRTHR